MKYCHCPKQEGKRVASDCEDCGGVVSAFVKSTHGSGSQRGRPPTGRKSITRSVSMPEPEWTELDRQRGNLSRGKWIAEMMNDLAQTRRAGD